MFRAKALLIFREIGMQIYEKIISQRQTLRRKLENINMGEDELVNYFITKNKMRALVDVVKEKSLVKQILRSMSRKFVIVVICIEVSKGFSKMVVDELSGILIDVEENEKKYNESKEFHLLLTQK